MSDINPWKPVNPRHPCPICHKKKWCGFLPGSSKVICMNVPSDHPTKNGGFLHDTGNTENAPEPTRIEKRRAARVAGGVNLQKIHQDSVSAFERGIRDMGSCVLGVSFDSLRRMEAGLIGTALSFPMRDGLKKLVGFRLRYPDGKKLTVKGTHNGLFIPTALKPDGSLLICEGPTDCAALLDLGYSAVGRPSCSGGTDHLIQFLKGQWRDIVIISDNDEPREIAGRIICPGIDGAMRLAGDLFRYARSIKVILPKFKDIREWVRKGATSQAVNALIRNAGYFKMQ